MNRPPFFTLKCVLYRGCFWLPFFSGSGVFAWVFLSKNGERKACDFLIRFSLFISFKKCDLLRKAVFKMVEISSLFFCVMFPIFFVVVDLRFYFLSSQFQLFGNEFLGGWKGRSIDKKILNEIYIFYLGRGIENLFVT